MSYGTNLLVEMLHEFCFHIFISTAASKVNLRTNTFFIGKKKTLIVANRKQNYKVHAPCQVGCVCVCVCVCVVVGGSNAVLNALKIPMIVHKVQCLK